MNEDYSIGYANGYETGWNAAVDEWDSLHAQMNCDTALLRQAVAAMEAALSDDQPYIKECKEAVAAIKGRL